ncbi:MAG: YbjN domain-containing protein [Ferrimicrobium sp.]|jgi:hypothetical protein|nr:YbjN domain-containing protein [Ferrimicrobium sp.]
MSEAKLTTERITKVLKDLDLHYLVDEDGDVVAPFSAEAEVYKIWFIVSLQGDLDCRVTLDRTIESDQCPRVLSMLNAWNLKCRMPKAFLRCDDNGRGRIILQHFSLLEPGVDDELLLHLLEVTIMAIGQSVTWIAGEFASLPKELGDSLGFDDLERMFHERA